jgi:hypothetical protein
MRLQVAQEKLDSAVANSESEEKINALKAAVTATQQKFEQAQARLAEQLQ